MREAGRTDNDLLDRLAADERLPLDRADLDVLFATPLSFTGRATEQVDAFVASVAEVVRRHPTAARYRPSEIL
jgi:adenylosuccinate lyase